ncbi:uncharacterized protein [Lepeophtheirus salmonis]|uniref:uncharacterized protein n=1 Tax=Lepeophtheirus salmonis TaxID=72036 RepID=UPI001AE69FD2|nr:histone H2A-like [Lepeophtheirus salmonis]
MAAIGAKTGKSGKKEMKGKSSSPTGTVFKSAHMRYVLKSRTKARISSTSLIALATGILYIIEEIIASAKSCAINDGKKTIKPCHVGDAIRLDRELAFLAIGWLIKSGGFRQTLPSTRRKKDE